MKKEKVILVLFFVAVAIAILWVLKKLKNVNETIAATTPTV